MLLRLLHRFTMRQFLKKLTKTIFIGLVHRSHLSVKDKEKILKDLNKK